MFRFLLRLKCSGRRKELRNRSRLRRHDGLLRPCLFLKFHLKIPLLVPDLFVAFLKNGGGLISVVTLQPMFG